MTRSTRTPDIEAQPLRFSAQEQAVVYEARQILLRHLSQNPVLTSWQAVLDYCALTIRGDVKRFHDLYLNRRNRLISDECLATGTVDHVPVYPREVLQRCLEFNASALIIVHNHPAGDPEPSAADLAMTKEIRNACASLGVILHDHIISGAGRETSLRARGELWWVFAIILGSAMRGKGGWGFRDGLVAGERGSPASVMETLTWPLPIRRSPCRPRATSP
ncbi:DNA repair protein RadC [Roseovarius pacificus]|uniref:RadC family protein n=1 Tax=Roseovarius pacificus TaxID=337701 RepID=UPI002A18B31E|nr:DNA repair protein RadC [Roseovarius pacificus]